MGKIPPSIIRQPPPPPHHHRSLTAANKEEEEEEEEEESTRMVGRNCTRTYHLSRCKKKRLTNNQSLPDDMLFEVLVHVPAQDIYDAARFVCWKWYSMIYTHNFIYEHLQHTTYGLLFHSCNVDSLYMTMRQGRVETYKLSKFRSSAWSSCNGLLLEFETEKYDTVYVTNPITKQIFVLPLFYQPSTLRRVFVMAYAEASMEYKVVVALPHGKDSEATFARCAILTVGVDNSWRRVRTEHLSYTEMEAFNCYIPRMTEGFIHWVATGGIILTLNVETEIITKTHRPSPQVRRPIAQRRRRYEGYGGLVISLSTGGRFLSLLIACGELLWEVWEMKPENGEWRKVCDIDLEDEKCTLVRLRYGYNFYEYIIPVGWLKYPEVLVFRFSGPRKFVFLYNVVTQEIDIDKVELPSSINSYGVLIHRNSLVWLAGC